MYPLYGQNEGLVKASQLISHFLRAALHSKVQDIGQALPQASIDTEVAGLIKHGPQGTSQTSVHVCRLPKLLTHCLPIDSSHNVICFREASRLATSFSYCPNKFLLFRATQIYRLHGFEQNRNMSSLHLPRIY